MSIVDWENSRKFKKLKEEFELCSDMVSLFQGDTTHPNAEPTERRFKEIKQELFEIDKNKADKLMKRHKEKVDERWNFIHWRARNFGL